MNEKSDDQDLGWGNDSIIVSKNDIPDNISSSVDENVSTQVQNSETSSSIIEDVEKVVEDIAKDVMDTVQTIHDVENKDVVAVVNDIKVLALDEKETVKDINSLVNDFRGKEEHSDEDNEDDSFIYIVYENNNTLFAVNSEKEAREICTDRANAYCTDHDILTFEPEWISHYNCLVTGRYRMAFIGYDRTLCSYSYKPVPIHRKFSRGRTNSI